MALWNGHGTHIKFFLFLQETLNDLKTLKPKRLMGYNWANCL